MKQYHWPNLVEMFFEQAERFGERPFLWRHRDGHYQPTTWRETAKRVCALARGLKGLGLESGERILVVSENRPAWLIADLAIMANRAITVPAFTTNTADDHRYILDNCEAMGAIVSTDKLAAPLIEAARHCKSLKFIIIVESAYAHSVDGLNILSWQDVIARGERDHTNVVRAAFNLKANNTACIIYTSGTGGAAKGVMLSHGAILHNCAGAADLLASLGGDDVFLSFLPLSHAYEHTAGQFLPIALGAEIYYAESVERIARNLLEARPTIMTAVPRFYELMHHRIIQNAHALGGLREKLFLAALSIGKKRYNNPHQLSLAERILDLVLDRIVRMPLRRRFGGRLKGMISGGARLNPDIGVFFTALGLPILQGYGQTETAPLISVNRPEKPKMHTVGPPLRNVEVRIAEDGELLVRGPMVMQGYWRNEDATHNAIRDGWLHTGDICQIDRDGHIEIIDRKKDIIVSSGGDNISPAKIESLLSARPEIEQALVFGDRQPHLVALLVPETQWTRDWAKQAGVSPELSELSLNTDFLAAMRTIIGQVNGNLSITEKIRKIAVAREPFSLENNQMTPTLKLRRHVIHDVYADVLHGLYQ